MKRILLVLSTLILAFSSSAFAQKAPLPIRDGRIFIQRGVNNLNNARIQTDTFEAISSMIYYDSEFFNVCTISSNPAFCLAGTSFDVPTIPTVPIGDQGGGSPQFASGPFTLNGVNYPHVWYFGELDFSASSFVVPRMLRRGRQLIFTRPFTMTGRLQVCSAVSNPPFCTGDQVVYDGMVTGHGTLTVTLSVESNFEVMPTLFAYGQSIDYHFEP